MIQKVVFRLVAIVIGIAATLLVVEVVLQTTSLVVKIKDHGEGVAPSEGEFRITCIGESTTYGLWPSHLQAILNEGSPGRAFRVINRGEVGIRTDDVARQIEGWLDEDRPHLVITMLGINDEGNVLVYPRNGSRGWLMEHSRTTRFLALLWRSAFDIGAPAETDDDGPRGDGHLDDEIRAELARLKGLRTAAMQRFRISETIEIERELIVKDPGTPVYHVSLLRELLLNHEQQERIDEFFSQEIGIDSSQLDEAEKSAEIERWMERTGDRLAGLKILTSIARWANDTEGETRLLEAAVDDPEIAGPAWLRMADFASLFDRTEFAKQCLLNADGALPDDYQWSLLLAEISFRLEAYDLSVGSIQRALALRPDLPTSHELVLLGQLANACEQSGDGARAAAYRAQRDDLELGRFREFTRFYYQRVVDIIRAREIPVIAMQYPLLSVESLRKLLDYREDVSYLENRANFEAALAEYSYPKIFDDTFAGSFGHLSPRGNRLVAENVAAALARMDPGIDGGRDP
jgi:hypothetical protein